METTVQCTNRRQHPIPWRRSPSTSSPSFLTSPPGLPVAGKRNYLVEIQAVLALLMLVSVKFVKEENWEAFIGDALFYAKVLLLAVTSVIDYHLSLCYLLTFIVIFVVTQQPPYAGLGYI